jgi:hypothetical protein
LFSRSLLRVLNDSLDASDEILRLYVIAQSPFSAPVDTDQEVMRNKVGHPFFAEIIP